MDAGVEHRADRGPRARRPRTRRHPHSGSQPQQLPSEASSCGTPTKAKTPLHDSFTCYPICQLLHHSFISSLLNSSDVLILHAPHMPCAWAAPSQKANGDNIQSRQTNTTQSTRQKPHTPDVHLLVKPNYPGRASVSLLGRTIAFASQWLRKPSDLNVCSSSSHTKV